MKVARFVVACAVLGLVVAWLASRHSNREAASTGSASQLRGASGTAPASGNPTRADTDATAIDTVVDAAASSDEPARVAVISEVPAPRWGIASPKPAIGRLNLRAVDATTLEPLHAFDVRLASDTRFADGHSVDPGGELELSLTPDAYSIVVSARGYESRELERATVTDGETTRLEPAEMRPGTGSIAIVIVGGLASGRGLGVELLGAGRRPCEQCGDVEDPLASDGAAPRNARAWNRGTPCPACGFAKERSRLLLGTRAGSAFENLASGDYALRLTDDRGFAAGEPRDVVLRDGEIARITLDLSGGRYVELELVDVDGRSLTEEWRLRLADEQEEVEIISFENALQCIPIALEFVDETLGPVATSSIVPPLPKGSISVGVGRGFSSRRFGEGVRKTADRARRPDDQLWPPPEPVGFGVPRIACEIEDSGLVRVGPLPSSRLELHVTAARFAADGTVPAARETTRLTLKLQSTLAAPDSASEPATYFACELANMK